MSQTLGLSDLILAAKLGNYGTVQQILADKLADVNGVDGETGWSALMFAANYGHFNVVKLLVDLGANVDYRDKYRRTALMLAACNGHTLCLYVLINDGKADKQLWYSGGINAWSYAKNNGHGDDILIESILSPISEPTCEQLEQFLYELDMSRLYPAFMGYRINFNRFLKLKRHAFGLLGITNAEQLELLEAQNAYNLQEKDRVIKVCEKIGFRYFLSKSIIGGMILAAFIYSTRE